MTDTMLTVDEVAAELRLRPDSLRRMLRQGRIRAVKIGKRYLIAPAELERIKTEGTDRAEAREVTLAGGRVVNLKGSDAGARGAF